jgi:hypothetical protein
MKLKDILGKFYMNKKENVKVYLQLKKNNSKG